MALIPVTVNINQFTSTEVTFLAGFADLTHSQGDVFYIAASGQVARLVAGTSGQVLSTQGAGANPQWIAAGGTGTVTSVSVVSANGFAGTVATATTTPAITLTTSITGTLQGNGTAISASKVTLTQPATGSTLTIIDGKTLTVNKTISFTAADDTGVYTLPTGTKTLLATDGAGTSLTGIPYTLTGTANQVVLSAGTGNITFSLPQSIATSSAVSFASVATSAASPLLLTNGQLVTIALTSQTVGGTTLTIPDFASVVDEFTFKTKAQTMSNKTFVAPVLGTPASGVATNLTGLPAAAVLAGSFGAGAYVISTTLTLGTSLLPDADDGAVLGAAGTAWSDLFLAEGAVINWDSGDATITQTGNDITIAGITTFGVGTSTAVTLGTIELGNGSDTTIARVSSGLISVEGITVVDVSTAQTLTNKTLTSPVLTTPSAFTTGGVITLAENTSIALDPAGSADGKYSGITIAGTAGATLAFGDLIYLAVADSRWELTDADAAATAGTPLIGICVLAAAADADPTTILLFGTIRADAKFPALTVGAPVYVGETAGAIQVAIPTGADNVIRIVGRALTADEILFNPSQDHQITVA